VTNNLIKEIENLKIKIGGEANKKLEEFKENFNISPKQNLLNYAFVF